MKTIVPISTMSLAVLLFSVVLAQSNSPVHWTKKNSQVWFDGKEWLKGLALQPHTSINKVAFAQQYHAHPSFWDSAFAFLGRKDLKTLPKGKYPIDGDNVFASVTEDPTKDFQNSRWESHRKYADIQYIIRGEEKIGVRPIAGATVTQTYDAKNDIAHYSGNGKQYLARPGTFFIFLPPDAHRPNITTGGNSVDKKIVIKVRVSGYESH